MREGPLTDLFGRTDEQAQVEQPLAEPIRPTGTPGGAYVAMIRVVGVGGGGGNAINRMIDAGLTGAEFVAINTDQQALDASEADVRIAAGMGLTGGRGTGGDIAKGAAAMKEVEDDIRDALKGSDLVFIAAGEGGGTGSGGAPVVARIARELGALTIAVVTRPFAFEGSRRERAAEEGLKALEDEADTVIVVPNDRLMSVMDRGTSMVEAFGVCDDLMRQGVQGICDMITLPGLINLDFADVRTVIRDAGNALLGIGYASGEGAAVEAALAAIESRLLETPIDGARGILLGITGGKDLSLVDVSEAAEVVQEAADPEANIIFGATVDSDLEDQVWVTVVAADFSGRRSAPPRERVRHEPAQEPARSAPEPLSAAPDRPRPEPSAPESSRPGAGGTISLERAQMAEPPEAPDLSGGVEPPYPVAAVDDDSDDDEPGGPPAAA
jgi:cell division protein FtsZ